MPLGAVVVEEEWRMIAKMFRSRRWRRRGGRRNSGGALNL
jgi:hypothetical protein